MPSRIITKCVKDDETPEGTRRVIELVARSIKLFEDIVDFALDEKVPADDVPPPKRTKTAEDVVPPLKSINLEPYEYEFPEPDDSKAPDPETTETVDIQKQMQDIYDEIVNKEKSDMEQWK